MTVVRRSFCALAVFCSVLSLGCQSRDAGVLLVCESPKHCTDCKDLPLQTQESAMIAYTLEHLRNEDVRADLRGLQSKSAADREAGLRKMAEEAGIAGCELADVINAAAAADAK